MELLGMAPCTWPIFHMHLTAYPQVAFSSGRGIQAWIVPTASTKRTIQDFLCSHGRAPKVALLFSTLYFGSGLTR